MRTFTIELIDGSKYEVKADYVKRDFLDLDLFVRRGWFRCDDRVASFHFNHVKVVTSDDARTASDIARELGAEAAISLICWLSKFRWFRIVFWGNYR